MTFNRNQVVSESINDYKRFLDAGYRFHGIHHGEVVGGEHVRFSVTHTNSNGDTEVLKVVHHGFGKPFSMEYQAGALQSLIATEIVQAKWKALNKPVPGGAQLRAEAEIKNPSDHDVAVALISYVGDLQIIHQANAGYAERGHGYFSNGQAPSPQDCVLALKAFQEQYGDQPPVQPWA